MSLNRVRAGPVPPAAWKLSEFDTATGHCYRQIRVIFVSAFGNDCTQTDSGGVQRILFACLQHGSSGEKDERLAEGYACAELEVAARLYAQGSGISVAG